MKYFTVNKTWHITEAHVCELKMYYAGEMKPTTKEHIKYNILISPYHFLPNEICAFFCCSV